MARKIIGFTKTGRNVYEQTLTLPMRPEKAIKFTGGDYTELERRLMPKPPRQSWHVMQYHCHMMHRYFAPRLPVCAAVMVGS